MSLVFCDGVSDATAALAFAEGLSSVVGFDASVLAFAFDFEDPFFVGASAAKDETATRAAIAMDRMCFIGLCLHDERARLCNARILINIYR